MSFQSATPLGPLNTQTNVWLTPKWLIDKLGPFDLDPCAYLPNGSPIIHTAKKYFTEKENGLAQTWCRDVFVNFPHSPIDHEWLKNG